MTDSTNKNLQLDMHHKYLQTHTSAKTGENLGFQVRNLTGETIIETKIL